MVNSAGNKLGLIVKKKKFLANKQFKQNRTNIPAVTCGQSGGNEQGLARQEYPAAGLRRPHECEGERNFDTKLDSSIGKSHSPARSATCTMLGHWTREINDTRLAN